MQLTPYCSYLPCQNTSDGSNSDAPALMMIHGWGLHGDIFAGLVPELSRNFQIYRIDLPGFGRSAIPNRRFDLELLTDAVLSVAPPQACYLGWSLGGLVAMHLAACHPERVQQLVTVAANPCFVQRPDWPTAMKPEVLEGFNRFLEEDFRGTLIRFLAIQTMGSETQKDDIALLKEVVFRHGEPGPRVLREGLAMLQKTDIRAELGGIVQPWLRIYGYLDGLVPRANAAAVSQLHSASEVLMLRKASHGPFISHRREFVAAVNTFLLRGAPGRAG